MAAIRILVGLLAIVSVAGSMAFAALLTHPALSPFSDSADTLPTAPANAVPAPQSSSGPPADQAEILLRVEQLKRRLQTDPTDGEGWKMLGRSLFVLKRYVEAVSAYSQAAELRPNDPEIRGALNQLETVAQQSGKHEK